MNKLNLCFRFICFSPCSKTFNWAENIFPMSHLLKQSHKCSSNTVWTTTVTICYDLTFKFEIADMMTKWQIRRANTLQKRAVFLCNYHRIVSNGHIAPVVDNYLMLLFDSSFILCIIIHSSWRVSVTSPKQSISSSRYSFILLPIFFIPNILVCTRVTFLLFVSLYT